MRSINRYLHFLLLGLFLIIVSPSLFSDGMFMDGLLYATISRNISEGIGSFWDLKLTDSFGASFHEHPPLAMGLQSVLFSIFGDSIYVERFYSLLTYLFTGLIVIRIWRSVSDTRNKGFSWLPLLYWMSVPLVLWAVSNNILENTMMIFTTLAIFLMIQGYQRSRWYYFSISGIILFLAFLSKGFVGLFPLALMFFLWVFDKRYSFLRMFKDSIIVVLFMLLPFLILYFVYPYAIENILAYIQNQVFGSLENSKTIDSRFFIVWRLVKELLPMMTITLLILIVTRARGGLPRSNSDTRKWAIVLFALALSGVLPIMISMKQSGFYIVSTFPVFAIVFAQISINPVSNYFYRIRRSKKIIRILSVLSVVLVMTGVLVAISQKGKIARDTDKLSDVYTITKVLKSNSHISIPAYMWRDWSLHGYMYRIDKISLTKEELLQESYLLVEKDHDNTIDPKYSKLDLELRKYELYEMLE